MVVPQTNETTEEEPRISLDKDGEYATFTANYGDTFSEGGRKILICTDAEQAKRYVFVIPLRIYGYHHRYV